MNFGNMFSLKTFLNLRINFLIVFPPGVSAAYSQVPTPCNVDYYKLGCYMDQYYPRGLPQLLFTDRDRSSPNFQQNIDWKNWDQYLHR